MRILHKIHFNSARHAHNAVWALHQLPAIRLGCCVMVALTDVNFRTYLTNAVMDNGGYFEDIEDITDYDRNAILTACNALHN